MESTHTKVCIVGNSGVGKSNIVSRLLTNTFDGRTRIDENGKIVYLTSVLSPTLGVEVHPNGDTTIWDIGGNNKLSPSPQDCFDSCTYFVVCFSANSEQSKQDAYGYWTSLIQEHVPVSTIVYVCNKSELLPNIPENTDVVYCSAKNNINIDSILPN